MVREAKDYPVYPLRDNKGYGKDSFPGQPYEPLKSEKLFLPSISALVYGKSFI
jgi:hypothetical protein